MYAWWKLVQTWAVFRFDDHRGIAPGAMRLVEKGLVFELDRAKTTGSGKQSLVRPAFVSVSAYIE
eukprot:9372744-Lingulodinium_polyedra.AAC.1